MSAALPLLERLVAVDTTSRTSNLDLLELVEGLLAREGVTAERVVSPEGDRANLVARIGPPVEGGIVLSAHTDCVPVTGQPWRGDPFRVRRDGDRLVGRGTADMKGFIAAVLAAVPRLAAADLRRPVLLALSYDEELGTVGAPSLVEHLLATQPRPAAVLVGEPTSMEVVTAHKGVRSYLTSVDGLDAHSSQPHRAANAVVAAARIASFLADLAAERARVATDARFDPPHTTVNVATISGGQAINIVPRRCELAWEYRPIPADDSDELLEQVRRHIDERVLPELRDPTGHGGIETRPQALARALATELRGPAEELARELTGYRGPDRTVAFGTDGGHFQAAGLSTVVCGPGSIDQAHQADEYVELAQLEACERMLDALLARLAR